MLEQILRNWQVWTMFLVGASIFLYGMMGIAQQLEATRTTLREIKALLFKSQENEDWP